MAASAIATATVIGVVPRTDGAPATAQQPAKAVLTTVTAGRLAAVIGDKYRLRFSDGSTGESAAAESTAVEESGTELVGGGRFDVVLFGGLPATVRSMACEVTRVDQQGAADLLGDCARVVAGDQDAPRLAGWISAELGVPDAGNPSAVVGETRYALRTVPASRAWVLAMSPRGS
jgi:hypothetical protein